MGRHVGEGTRTWCESMGIHLRVHHVERHSRQTAPALSTREEARRVPWGAARPERCAPRVCGLSKRRGFVAVGAGDRLRVGDGGLSPAARGFRGGEMGKYVAGLSPSFPEAGMGLPPPGGNRLYTLAELVATFGEHEGTQLSAADA